MASEPGWRPNQRHLREGVGLGLRGQHQEIVRSTPQRDGVYAKGLGRPTGAGESPVADRRTMGLRDDCT